MPSSLVPQLRFICESLADASNYPHDSSAKATDLIKADALRNYWAVKVIGEVTQGAARAGGPPQSIAHRRTLRDGAGQTLSAFAYGAGVRADTTLAGG